MKKHFYYDSISIQVISKIRSQVKILVVSETILGIIPSTRNSPLNLRKITSCISPTCPLNFRFYHVTPPLKSLQGLSFVMGSQAS